jgi:glutamate formiminotransferase
VPVLESVPNVSEGRDPETIAAVARAFTSRGATLLDLHADADHHRSVFTLAGADEALVESLLAGIAVARERIDLRRHHGVHPRVGAVDVVPLVPLAPAEMARAVAAATRLAARVGEELGLPVFLYGENGGGRRPAFFRRGGPDELQRRVDAGEIAPAFGPRRLDAAAGAVLVGARKLLVAFNVELATTDVEIARAVAASVRESSGGLRGVQALGLLLAATGNAQVSLNIVDIELAHLHEVVARVREEASARGAAVVRGERVGLLPAAVVQRAAGAPGGELPSAETLAAAAAALFLEALPAGAVLELQLRARGLF